jgi:hypothetical protein
MTAATCFMEFISLREGKTHWQFYTGKHIFRTGCFGFTNTHKSLDTVSNKYSFLFSNTVTVICTGITVKMLTKLSCMALKEHTRKDLESKFRNIYALIKKK